MPRSRRQPTVLHIGLSLFATIVVLGALRASTSFAQTAWVDPAWEHRIQVTAQADSIEGGTLLADFPLLIQLDPVTHADVFASAKPDGSDLVVTAGNGTTVLDRDVVSFDASGEGAEIWVRCPLLSKTQHSFYLYYGNPGADLPASSGGTWSSAYHAVYHFEADPGLGVLPDWSSAGADIGLAPAANWTSADTTVAPIGKGWFFNGSTHHLATTAVGTTDSSYVMSAWLKNTAPGTDFFFQANPDFWHVSSQASTNSARPDYSGGGASVKWGPGPVPQNDGYHHFAWVFDGVNDTIVFYFDGVPQPIFTTYPYALDPIYTGRPINPGFNESVGILGPMFSSSYTDYMDGGADEFRFREGVESAGWIATEVRNQRDPAGFFVFGSQETFSTTAVADPLPGVDQPLPSTFALRQNVPNPVRDRTSISFSLGSTERVQMAVYDVAGRRVSRLLDRQMSAGYHAVHWNGRDDDGHRLPRGVYYLRMETPERRASIKMTLLQ